VSLEKVWFFVPGSNRSYSNLFHVYLADSLDCLSELAATLFSPIPNRGQVPLPSIPDHPFGPEEKGVRFALIARLYYLAVPTPNVDLGLRTND
jgi:hypothetical protein